MNLDDLQPRPTAKVIAVGDDLSALSVDELDARVQALEAEIERIKRERAAKQARNRAADQLFKR